MAHEKVGQAILEHLRPILGEEIDDAELLAAFLQRSDSTAFELLVRRHVDLVRRVVSAWVRDRDEVDDCVQAVFFVLARKAGTLKQPNALIGWLVRTARRVAMETTIKTRRRRTQTTSEFDGIACVKNTIFPREEQYLLMEEIERLAEKYRLPILLIHFEGHTHEEAARRLGWKLGTFNTRMLKARQLLQCRLVHRGFTLGLIAALTTTPATGAFIRETVRGSLAFATREPLSSPATLLAKGVLRQMMLTTLLRFTAIGSTTVLLMAAAVVFGAEPVIPQGEPPPTIEVKPTEEKSKGEAIPKEVERVYQSINPLKCAYLLCLDSVRKEIGCDAKCEKELSNLVKALELVGNIRPFELKHPNAHTLPPELAKKFLSSLDASQVTRLKQVWLQVQTANLVITLRVGNYLEITDEQLDIMDNLLLTENDQVAPASHVDRKWKNVMGYLTVEQRAKLQTLYGKEVESRRSLLQELFPGTLESVQDKLRPNSPKP